ncbi:MAG: GAF domain-containing protein [Ferruginibacter sp.]
MHTDIIHILPEDLSAPSCKRIISFRPFLNYIKGVRDRTNGHKKYFFSHVVEQFELHPEVLQSVEIDRLKDYKGLLELIYNSLSKMVVDEETNYWALSVPMKPTIFYSTNAFHNLISRIAVDNICSICSKIGSIKIEGNPIEFVYAVVLEKQYGIPAFFSREIVHAVEDPETGLTRYYEANLDTRFIEIIAEKEMPQLRFDVLKSANYDRQEKLKWIQEALPFDLFRFEGFGITSITDVSVKYALENIKNFILNHDTVTNGNYFSDVIHWMKIIVENNDIEFGLLPALHVNNKLVFNEGLYVNSLLINAAKKKGMEENNYLAMIDKYFSNPKLIFFSEITAEEEEKHSYLKLLSADGIMCYALIPVYFGNELVGVLEVYSKKKVAFNEVLLSKLDPVVPLLSQLLKNGIHEFHDGIDRVIKDKFTSVQPSVQWKFNEAAWHFLRDKQNNETIEIEDIHFENVYPLYGAIDIRNSTIERNNALSNDMQVQFTVLISMLEKLKKQSGFGLIDEKIFLAKKWLADIKGDEFTNQVLLDDFLDYNIIPFLIDFMKGNKDFEMIINEYFEAIDDKTGKAYEKRRELEKSMNTVINAVNKYLEKMQEEVQQAYPSYFEKFRTDGVEYDIYIGQSIAPSKPFSDIYLKNLRLMQLSSMASIAKLTAKTAAELTKNIQTTQLIFIHSQPISIQFRTDEKRFDVEGAYNIRYHIVKKRIDKVLVKGTQERLTQPDKISLVYTNQQDANDYIGYINFLQGQNILLNDLEELELEELQGVNGLKALRVGVVKEEKAPEANYKKPDKNLQYPNPISNN